MAGETVLVTGGSGWLAGFCIASLLDKGYRVKTTVRSLSREAEVRAGLAKLTSAPGAGLSFHQADLTADAGWTDAVKDCDYVLHVASPFPVAQPKDADELIVPAREGTLRVLRAAVAQGVKRVVLTSSIAAVAYGTKKTRFDETDWTDLSSPGLTPYVQSKTVAERAAWNFMKDHGGKTTLSVVNPAGIVGPVFSKDFSTSIALVQRLMNGSTPGIPRLGFAIVDVRDLAELHILAMTRPEAAGQRYLAASKSWWMGDIAKVLRERLGADAAKVPTRNLPSWLVRVIALFDPGIRSVTASLDKRSEFDLTKSHALGWTQRPVEDTVIDCARSLIAEGAV